MVYVFVRQIQSQTNRFYIYIVVIQGVLKRRKCRLWRGFPVWLWLHAMVCRKRHPGVLGAYTRIDRWHVSIFWIKLIFCRQRSVLSPVCPVLLPFSVKVEGPISLCWRSMYSFWRDSSSIRVSHVYVYMFDFFLRDVDDISKYKTKRYRMCLSLKRSYNSQLY